jgi:glucosamine-6-phosphate deaminase
LSGISREHLREWLAVPVDELAERSPIPLTILPTVEDVHRRFAEDLLEEIEATAAAGEALRLIVPVGPTGQYPLLAAMLNERATSLAHVMFYGMDEWLDWEGRPLGSDHPFSLEGGFRRLFLDRLDPAIRPAEDAVVFPSPYRLETTPPDLAEPGSIATTYGGFGYRGHLAFNEPPGSALSPVTLEQLRRSRTRVLPVTADTIVAHSQRALGGNHAGVPPMAVTLGMSELLNARRVRLYTDSGAWKQTILRIILFAEPTVDYPATLVSGHPDVAIVVDEASAACPSSGW